MGGGKEEEGEGDKGKVSCFCLQLKEFSINFSLETETLLKKNLYFHLLAQGKLSHSFLSHTSSFYVFQGKKRMSNSLVLLLFKGEKNHQIHSCNFAIRVFSRKPINGDSVLVSVS